MSLPKRSPALRSEDEPLPDIGRRVKRARKELGLTQQQLGDQTGIEQSAIARFERGERGLKSRNLIALFQRLSELGIDVGGFVLSGTGELRRREVSIVAANPDLASALRRLADGLEERRIERGATDERPGAGDKR